MVDLLHHMQMKRTFDGGWKPQQLLQLLEGIVFSHDVPLCCLQTHQGTLHCDVDRVAIAQACFAEGQELLEVISNKPWLYPIERVL